MYPSSSDHNYSTSKHAMSARESATPIVYRSFKRKNWINEQNEKGRDDIKVISISDEIDTPWKRRVN